MIIKLFTFYYINFYFTIMYNSVLYLIKIKTII